MTLTELQNLLTTNLTRVGANRISGPEILQSVQAVVDYFATQVADIIPDWTDSLVFQTDGSDAGKYCTYPDSNGTKRIFETKIDDNVGNAPPSSNAITENAFWREVSSSAVSSIKEWSAGLYGDGLIIAYYNHPIDGEGLYLLKNPARPFLSSNIETEINAGDWVRLFNRVGVENSAEDAKSIMPISRFYFFTGNSEATWTLYPVINNAGIQVSIKNMGSQTLTIQSENANELFDFESKTAIEIYPGERQTFLTNGNYHVII